MKEESFRNMKYVPDTLLAERIELVKVLSEEKIGTYEIVKDRLTGEHYLHYVYMQLNISGAGEEEMYYQLMPIDSDEVLTLMFDNPDYHYPTYWKSDFLRNGPDGRYVWFSPDYAVAYEDSVKLGAEIEAKLKQFKEAGQNDPEAVKKLMEELDQMRKREKLE